MSELYLGPGGSLAVERGRDASARLRDMVREHRAKGDQVVEVRVSQDVANNMRAFFAMTFAEFDNVLPPSVLGAPFAEGGTGGRDYIIRTRKRGEISRG